MPRKRPHKKKAFSLGTIHVSEGGRSYVETDQGRYVLARAGLREAMDKDKVEVSLVRGRGASVRAYVQHVVERAHSSFVGRFEPRGPLGEVVPIDKRLGHEFYVVPEDKSPQALGVRQGDYVRARIIDYPSRKNAGQVTLEERIENTELSNLAVESIIAGIGFSTSYPTAALEEAAQLKLDAEAELTKDPERVDMRELLCITIDPADARDYDDALSARRTVDGYELVVHIADVSHYVSWNSSLDNEAKRRGCSAYLVDRVIPMLPEALSNELCSLKANEDRLSMSITMQLSPQGELLSAEANKSLIRSNARLSYDEALAILEDQNAATSKAEGSETAACHPAEQHPAELVECLAVLNEIAKLRECARTQRGAISFETVEAHVVLDEQGKVKGVVPRTKTAATALVEEAMLLANEAVASMLVSHGMRSAYRVHERPSPDTLAFCVGALRELDVLKAGEWKELVAGDPFVAQAVLDRAAVTDAEIATSSLLLRAQKKAVYRADNLGHYALAARAYCHFTSPIRRYPDLMVHRCLKALIEGKNSAYAAQVQQQDKFLESLCRSSSEQERAAEDASRASQAVKLAEYLSTRIGEHFFGTVVSCRPFGIFVMLDGVLAEGLVPVRELGEEYFDFDEEHLTLTGSQSGDEWRLGQRVEVVIDSCDSMRGHVNLRLAK